MVDLIETDYLLGMYKLGTHNKTKARHVFHELVNDNFLNGAFDDFIKKQYEDIIKKYVHIIKRIEYAKKWT